MMQIILLELIGCLSIFNICSIWSISYEEHILALIFVSTILITYLTIHKKWGIIKEAIKHVDRNYHIKDIQRENNYIIEVRKLGIFLAGFGIIGLPIIISLSGWAFIGIEIIARSVVVTTTIILYTLLFETTIILPLDLLIQYKIKQNESRALSLYKNKIIDITKVDRNILLKRLK